MSDDMIACWRTNYGLHMAPHELAEFWDGGLPAGCAMALKVACERIEADAALLRQALEALELALPVIAADARMMADITRHAPLDPESQAKHDATEYVSERLERTMPTVIAALRERLGETT